MSNRELKFRAWDEQSKQMHVPMTLSQIKQVIAKSTMGETGTLGSIFAFTFDSLVFMQYTGLKDKNGKEIYEGDRLKVWTKDKEGYDYDGTVIWENAGWRIKFESKSFPFNPDLYIWCKSPECEIIGNIYESPEHLK